MNPSEKALLLFHKGYNCSQSVFGAFARECGLEERQALALSSSFGAGIGRMRHVCGAFCGLAMAYGAIKGNDSTAIDDRQAIYADIQKLAERFRTEFGALDCRDLLGLQDAAGQEGTRPGERTPEFYSSRPCERCILFCARLGEELL